MARMTDIERLQARLAEMTDIERLEARVAALTDLVDFLINVVDDKLFVQVPDDLWDAFTTMVISVEAKAS